MFPVFAYPALVSGDWHIHGRGNRTRLSEAETLFARIEEMQVARAGKGEAYRSLVIAGDLLDRGGALPVATILQMAQLFRKFEQVWIVVGNHDCPVRSTAVTQLDIFSLCGAYIVKTPTVSGSALFLPYYTKMPASVPKSVRNVFAHKDVKEFNSYFDEEWAVSVVDFPPEATVFNGHLHAANITQHSPQARYVQLGAPYPCTWSDDYQRNQWAWTVEEDSFSATEALLVTGDEGQADTALYQHARVRQEKPEQDADVDESAILNALAAADDGRMSIQQALTVGRVTGRVAKVIESVVSRVVGKVEGVRL